MKYKTYKGKPTKYIKSVRNENKIKAIFLILFFTFAIGSAISNKPTSELGSEKPITNQLEAQNTTTQGIATNNQALELIPLLTNNYEQEIDVRRAIDQACKYIGADKDGYEIQCQKDLLGIAYAEHRDFNYLKAGDNGNSHGAFQIHLGYHSSVTVSQAEDPYWSAIWTAKRLVHYGYPEYRSYSIQKHNGTPNTSRTLSYLNTVNSIALK